MKYHYIKGAYNVRAGSHKPPEVYISTKYWKCKGCSSKFTSRGVEYMTGGTFPMPIRVKDDKCPTCGESLLSEVTHKVELTDEQIEQAITEAYDNVKRRISQDNKMSL